MLSSELQGESRVRIASILSHPGTMATVLYAIVLKEFGEDVHSWEPETVFMEINDSFGIDMPESNHDKLMALLVAIDTNSFYGSWSGFEVICRTLNTGDVFGSDDLLVAEMAWGVTEVMINDDTPGVFSDEIASGVGRLLLDEGIVSPPPRLSFAKFPEQYLGSFTESDTGKQQTLSSEHEEVVRTYLQEQSALLLKQIASLPWHTEETLVDIIEGMSA
jgi:hypothetical protein